MCSLDTGRLNPETYKLFHDVEKRYGIRIEYTFPDAQETMDFVRAKGMFSFYEDGHQECCRVRKVALHITTSKSTDTCKKVCQNLSFRSRQEGSSLPAIYIALVNEYRLLRPDLGQNRAQRSTWQTAEYLPTVDLLQVRPLRRQLKTLKAWITGQRKDQSPGTRTAVPVAQIDPVFEGLEGGAGSLVKFNPLSDVTSQEVWNFLRVMVSSSA